MFLRDGGPEGLILRPSPPSRREVLSVSPPVAGRAVSTASCEFWLRNSNDRGQEGLLLSRAQDRWELGATRRAGARAGLGLPQLRRWALS